MSVSTGSIICILITLILEIAIPFGVMIFINKKHDTNISTFFIGCATFIVFSLVLERFINTAIFKSPAGANIMANNFLFALIGGLMAGLFEETGRFVAFNTILKKDRDDDTTALMYGAGHGGIEVLLIATAMISNLVMANMINSGNLAMLTAGQSGEKLVAIQATITQLCETKPAMFLVSVVERIPALIMHICFSVIVWTGCKNKKWFLFPAAIGFHTLVDFVAGFTAKCGWNVMLTELVLYIMAIALVVFTYLLAKKEKLGFIKTEKK